jgi:hypothetical protein
MTRKPSRRSRRVVPDGTSDPSEPDFKTYSQAVMEGYHEFDLALAQWLPARDANGLTIDAFITAIPKCRLDEITKSLGDPDVSVSIERALWHFHLDCERQLEHHKRLERASELAAALAAEADVIARLKDPETARSLSDFASIPDMPGPSRPLRSSGLRWLRILDEYAARTKSLHESKGDGRPSYEPFKRLVDYLTEVYVAVTGLAPRRRRYPSANKNEQFELHAPYRNFVRVTINILKDVARELDVAMTFPTTEDQIWRYVHKVTHARAQRHATPVEKPPAKQETF